MPNYILDKFVSTKAGEPYRLFPFGEISRGGKTRNITPEYAAQFKLPPFKPPVKLGSHEDTTPAGGHITRLEVREDGLYAHTEYTEKGGKSIAEGDYRYHSPEVIWDDGALETSDGVIAGPLIVGDALLHTPYLGESTAFYTSKEIEMAENTVAVDKGLLEKLLDLLKPATPEQPAPVVELVPAPVTEAAEFKAVVQEREDFKAQLDAIKAEQAAKETKANLTAQLQKKEDFGAVFAEAPAADEAAGVLATMTEAQRDYVMRNFRALIAQIDESKLTNETGTEKGAPLGDDPKAEFNAQVLKAKEEKGVNYVEAFELTKTTHAELFKSAFGK
jgi:hypothetical protein